MVEAVCNFWLKVLCFASDSFLDPVLQSTSVNVDVIEEDLFDFEPHEFEPDTHVFERYEEMKNWPKDHWLSM